MTFCHAPIQPIREFLAPGQRLRHFLASGQRVHNFSASGQRVRHFPVQGRRARRLEGLARSNFSAIPKVSHAARRTHVGPKGPNHGDGGEGRDAVGCAEGAPLRDISSLNHFISLNPIGASPAGAHRTHKLNRNTNEEQ